MIASEESANAANPGKVRCFYSGAYELLHLYRLILLGLILFYTKVYSQTTMITVARYRISNDFGQKNAEHTVK